MVHWFPQFSRWWWYQQSTPFSQEKALIKRSSDTLGWLKGHPKGSLLFLYIQPGASKNEITGLHGDRLKVKIKAPPRDGQANASLIEFVAEILGISKTKVFLVRGESSRQKDLLVELSTDRVLTSLELAQ